VSYDQLLEAHYNKVAETDGVSSSSTMKDEIIRTKEMEAVLTLVDAFIKERKVQGDDEVHVVDVGCGNGFTLKTLAENFPNFLVFSGIENNEKLYNIACLQTQDEKKTSILRGDVRESLQEKCQLADILICQRVLINLLDEYDQKVVLRNIINLVKSGGMLIFIEAFKSGLKNLNEARRELCLDEITESHHNLYLEDSFFDSKELQVWQSAFAELNENFLSTHYFIARVWHAFLVENSRLPFVRNSHFVNFWSGALPDSVGEYSPLKIKVFIKD